MTEQSITQSNTVTESGQPIRLAVEIPPEHTGAQQIEALRALADQIYAQMPYSYFRELFSPEFIDWAVEQIEAEIDPNVMQAFDNYEVDASNRIQALRQAGETVAARDRTLELMREAFRQLEISSAAREDAANAREAELQERNKILRDSYNAISGDHAACSDKYNDLALSLSLIEQEKAALEMEVIRLKAEIYDIERGA